MSQLTFKCPKLRQSATAHPRLGNFPGGNGVILCINYTDSRVIYPSEKGERRSQKVIARVRCSNTEEWKKYWCTEEERKCMLSLSIKVEGRCAVRWFEEKKRKNTNGRKETYLEDFTALETYFERIFYIIRSTDNDVVRQLTAGENVYPFNFSLPQNIPCSFEHKFGSILYFVTATFIENSDSCNPFDRAKFKVLTPYDLNQSLRAAVGIDDEEYQHFCCFCVFKMGSLHARVKTPVSGFVPGQILEVTVSFYNDSATVEVQKIKVALEKIIKFQSTRPKNVIKCERAIIGKDKKRGSFGDKNEIILFIKVPQVLPSNLVHCSLIEIQYRLKVKIITSGAHKNIEKSYPILIGTVPLYSSSAAVVPLVHVQRPQSIVPTAPTIEAIVPVPQANVSLNQSSSSQQNASVGNQSFTIVHNSREEEYQPIGFVFTNHTSQCQNLASSAQPETPPPSYEECTSTTQNSAVSANSH
ncbi:arrestin domain-containing protein 17-like [Belonocnema kinseyi]|uniref:arrestin domain-containing protein 17-like n=1 Tax=Belonocnema kinseyi TaxID=2817044 RepID=UPI00143DF376|nr:arrestin domain-containing protein 17-like [Belonocnema kinseyi]